MFHHVVLYQLREGVTLDRVRTAREALGALVETLPGVAHFAVTHNETDDPTPWNLVLFSVFEDRAACNIFLRHPEFQRIQNQELAPVVADRLVAQGHGA